MFPEKKKLNIIVESIDPWFHSKSKIPDFYDSKNYFPNFNSSLFLNDLKIIFQPSIFSVLTVSSLCDLII